MDDLGSRVHPDAGIVGGVLVRLDDDPSRRARALEALRGRPDILLGEAQGPWLPLALEAEGPRRSRDLHEWLTGLPGVRFVEVVAVHFEADFAEPTPAGAGEPALLSHS